jgi:hypothetical protein
MQNNLEHYPILRERIGRKLDALCEHFDQLAPE